MTALPLDAVSRTIAIATERSAVAPGKSATPSDRSEPATASLHPTHIDRASASVPSVSAHLPPRAAGPREDDRAAAAPCTIATHETREPAPSAKKSPKHEPVLSAPTSTPIRASEPAPASAARGLPSLVAEDRQTPAYPVSHLTLLQSETTVAHPEWGTLRVSTVQSERVTEVLVQAAHAETVAALRAEQPSLKHEVQSALPRAEVAVVHAPNLPSPAAGAPAWAPTLPNLERKPKAASSESPRAAAPKRRARSVQ